MKCAAEECLKMHDLIQDLLYFECQFNVTIFIFLAIQRRITANVDIILGRQTLPCYISFIHDKKILQSDENPAIILEQPRSLKALNNIFKMLQNKVRLLQF